MISVETMEIEINGKKKKDHRENISQDILKLENMVIDLA